jgi:hypothetical protein
MHLLTTKLGEAHTMSKCDQIPLADPPAPRAPAVIDYLAACKRSLASLEATRAEVALAAAVGKPDGKAAMAALGEQISALKFEIDCHPMARELASRLDEDAVTSWKAEVQVLTPDEIVAGIASGACCRRCSPGNYCIITASDSRADPAVCAHPMSFDTSRPYRSGDAAHRGEDLKERYGNPVIQANYEAARKKLKV